MFDPRSFAALTAAATLVALGCEQSLDERCLAVFDRLCDECPRNVGVFVDPDPVSTPECRALVQDECRDFAGKTYDAALADECEADASCESFEGDTPESCEELFARPP